MKNNSRNLYEAFGNVEKKEIDYTRLSFQHKLMHSNLNYSAKKPRISRNSTTKELKKKLLQKRESMSAKKKENFILGNKFLEYKNLSMNRNKFASISTNNSINLTYQEKPKIYNNYYAINNLKQEGKILGYKQKIKKFSDYEKLMTPLMTKRKERTKSKNKNGKIALTKSKKITKKTATINPELISNITKNNSRNKHENFGNIDKKGKNQNYLAFQHKYNLSTNKKQKSLISISTNELNEKLFPKKTISLNNLNNYSEYKKCYTNRNKISSISTKNSFKCNNKYNTISNLKQEKTSKKRKISFREKLGGSIKAEINNAVNQSFINITNECNKSPIKIKANPLELKNNIFSKKINELEKENNKLKKEIDKLEKEICNKDAIIKNQELKIKDYKNTFENTIINKNKELEKLLDEIKKIKSNIPFEILPGEKIMSIIFKSDDQNILYSVLCKNTDKFERLENIIYDKYPEYKKYEKYFLFKGEKINEIKTLEENKINDGSILTICCNYD